MKITLSDILKIIQFFKPKFYNKLTWLMVVAGLSLMSTPIWRVLAGQLLDKEFNFTFSDGNDIAWGFSLCSIALLYNLISTGLHELLIKIHEKEDNKKAISHDCNTYSALNEIISEDFLKRVISSLETSDAIHLHDLSVIEKFVSIASGASNTFVTEHLKERTTSLVDSLNKLRQLVSSDFDEYPYGQAVTNFRMCLAPQLNCDQAGKWEDGPAYTVLADKMMAITGKINSEYKQWRLAVKDTLYI